MRHSGKFSKIPNKRHLGLASLQHDHVINTNLCHNEVCVIKGLHCICVSVVLILFCLLLGKWLACQSMDNKICVFNVLNRFKYMRKKTFTGHMVSVHER